jgi:hypothetical protein
MHIDADVTPSLLVLRLHLRQQSNCGLIGIDTMETDMPLELNSQIQMRLQNGNLVLNRSREG